jgi:Kdo2-lipid IVA lauroyltransferase/acyltransferase
MMLFAFRALALLPLSGLHVLGALLGWIVYWVSPAYRHRIRANLPALVPARAQVLHQAIGEAGKQALELAWVWTRSAGQVRSHAHWDEPERFAALMAQDRAMLLLTPHLGCFEMIAQSYMVGPIGTARPMLALFRVPRKDALRPLFQNARARFGLLLAPADLAGVRLMLRALRERKVVGLLPDQVPSRGEGVWAPFFGRPAFTMTLPARLALAHDAQVVLIIAERLPRGAGYQIHWQALEEALEGDPQADAARINRAMERLILRCPAQYLWSYNRYKAPPGVDAPPAGPAP